MFLRNASPSTSIQTVSPWRRTATRDSVRTVSRLAVARAGDLLTIEVEADAFLKNMVRILVGTLVEIGWGRRAPDDARRVLDGRDRRVAGVTAPPQGLMLVRVDYRGDRLPSR